MKIDIDKFKFEYLVIGHIPWMTVKAICYSKRFYSKKMTIGFFIKLEEPNTIIDRLKQISDSKKEMIKYFNMLEEYMIIKSEAKGKGFHDIPIETIESSDFKTTPDMIIDARKQIQLFRETNNDT